MDNNTKVRNWQLNSLRSERRLSWDSWERGGPESENQDRYHHGDRGYVDHTRYGGYSRERHDRGGYESRHYDDGLDIGRRREKVPKFHGEPHSRRVRDHNRNKVYEWLTEEEVSSEARKSPNSRHGGGDTSRRGIPPKKVDLSHPIRPMKVPLELSSNFPPLKSLIQSNKRSSLYFKCDDVDHVVKERVNHRADFVDHDDEEQCEDEKESMATHEEDTHPTFNEGVSSIVEAEDECKPIKALKF